MSEAEDVCGCLFCAVLCGVCCVAAAEEDKRERERAAVEAQQLKNPGVMVNPVAVPMPHSQQKESQMHGSSARKDSQIPMLESIHDKKKKPKKSKHSGSSRKRKP